MSKTYDAHREAARRVRERLLDLQQSGHEIDPGLHTQLMLEMFDYREAQRAADPERFEKEQAAAVSGLFRIPPDTHH